MSNITNKSNCFSSKYCKKRQDIVQPIGILTKNNIMDNVENEKVAVGGCEGPDSMYVKLISSDGHEFIIKRKHAMLSGTIKAMLSRQGESLENETNEVKFVQISSLVLATVCEYLAYKARYMGSGEELPNFDMASEICLEVLMAANFLDC
uniref:Elongin-C n=1 Tax=Strigamia maritima TaxID=126957 RepID=T1JKP0_STRMM